MPDKIAPLTSLRFFAALGVLIYHLLSIVGAQPVGAFALGVSFFFVLSGFILTFTYGRRPGFSPRDFLISRFARLWPVHVVTLCIAIALFGIETPGALFLNLALVHAWPPVASYVFSYNWVSWSISDELAFYLLFPLLAFGPHFGRRFALIAAAIAALLFALQVRFTVAAIYEMPPFGFSPFLLIMQNPAVRLLEFAAGVGAGRLFLAGHFAALFQRRRSATLIEFAALLLVGGYAVTAEGVSNDLVQAGLASLAIWYGQSGGFVVFAVLVFVFAYSGGIFSRALGWPPLVLLGEISFCTYMVHQLCTRFALGHGLVGPGDAFSFRMVALIAAVYLASYLLWRFVERPARAFIVTATRARATR